MFVHNYIRDCGIEISHDVVKEIVEIYYGEFSDGTNRDETFCKITNEFNEFFGGELKFQMTKEAFDAFINVQRNNDSIILGGPGRGKTTICRVICHSLPKYEPIFLAPSGKAVVRIKESCETKENPVKNGKYFTIDRFLIDQKFKKSKMPHHLKCLFIIDEISMIDSFKLSELLKYFSKYKNSKFVWVGDLSQLPPVSFGMPFKSLMNINDIVVPKIKLIKNFRNETNTCDMENKIQIAKNLYELNKHIAIKIVPEEVDKSIDIIEKYYKKGFQIISYTNNVCKLINDSMYPDNIITKGTPVILKKNRYDKNGKLEYCNGMRAKIARSEIKKYHDEYKIWVYWMKDEKTLEYSNEEKQIIIKNTNYIQKAAAITIHCVQGSEYNNVLIFYSNKIKIIEEELLYVACSRNRKESIFLYGGDDLHECQIFRKKKSNSFIDGRPEEYTIYENVLIKTQYDAENAKNLGRMGFKYNKKNSTWSSTKPVTKYVIDELKHNKFCKIMSLE